MKALLSVLSALFVLGTVVSAGPTQVDSVYTIDRVVRDGQRSSQDHQKWTSVLQSQGSNVHTIASSMEVGLGAAVLPESDDETVKLITESDISVILWGGLDNVISSVVMWHFFHNANNPKYSSFVSGIVDINVVEGASYDYEVTDFPTVDLFHHGKLIKRVHGSEIARVDQVFEHALVLKSLEVTAIVPQSWSIPTSTDDAMMRTALGAVLKPINSAQFKAIIAANKVVIVMWYLTYNEYCKRLLPHFLEDANDAKYSGFKSVLLDVEVASDVITEFKVDFVPTIVLHKTGAEVERVQGAYESRVHALFEHALSLVESEENYDALPAPMSYSLRATRVN